jgi:hypothetical protein
MSRCSLELGVPASTLAACLLFCAVAAAVPPDRDEARQRFDRGLILYNAGDFTGALAEFERAHEISGHALVLYNVALVQARLGNSAEAVNAFETLARRGFAELGKQRAEHARKVYEEQRLRVGTLEIESNVKDATLQVDNVDVPRQSAKAVRVTAGNHLISLWSAGHAPRHLAVTVAGGSHKRVKVDLIPIAQPVCLLRVTSNVPDVEIREGKQLLGKLPLAAPLPFAPGTHTLDFTRKGYVPARQPVQLPPGGSGHLEIPMRPSSAGLTAGATLSLDISEPNAVVSVDGEAQPDYARGLRLPVGRHLVRVERAGFRDLSRDVVLEPGTNALDVSLLPTPQYLGDYVASAKRQRTLGLITAGAGALAAAGGAGFLIWNQGKKNEAERRFHDYRAEVEQRPEGDRCDASCEQQFEILTDDLDAKRKRDVFGWIGVGVGAAAIGAGGLIYFLGDDPKRYDPKPESDVFASLRLTLKAHAVALSGAF